MLHLILGMMQTSPSPQMQLAVVWLSGYAYPRSWPAKDVIKGPRDVIGCWPNPQESEESLAQANRVLLWVEVQITGIGQRAVMSPEDRKSPLWW